MFVEFLGRLNILVGFLGDLFVFFFCVCLFVYFFLMLFFFHFGLF